MKKPRSRRPGSTETFSVSVDPETKRALRKLADTRYGGNLSALVTDFAEEARRRMAAAQYLDRHGVAEATPAELREIEAGIEREVRVHRARRRRRVA